MTKYICFCFSWCKKKPTRGVLHICFTNKLYKLCPDIDQEPDQMNFERKIINAYSRQLELFNWLFIFASTSLTSTFLSHKQRSLSFAALFNKKTLVSVSRVV